jgi:hypothetical protein
LARLNFSCIFNHNILEVKTVADKKENKSKAQKKAEDAAKAFVSETSFKADPSGSYTGHPKNKYDQPEQDGDDL